MDNLDDKTADFRFDFAPFKTCSKTILLSSLASVIAAKDREKKDDYMGLAWLIRLRSLSIIPDNYTQKPIINHWVLAGGSSVSGYKNNPLPTL